MAFTSNRQVSISNQDIKEEKSILERELQEVSIKIASAKKDKKQFSDLTEEIKNLTEEISSLKIKRVELANDCDAKTKEFDKIRTDHFQAVTSLGQILTKHVAKSNEIIEKEAHVSLVAKKTIEIENKVNSANDILEQTSKKIDGLVLLKRNIEGSLNELTIKKAALEQSIEKYLIKNQQLYLENINHQKDSSRLQEELEQLAESILAKQQDYKNAIIQFQEDEKNAQTKIDTMFSEAQKEIDAKKLALEQREGEVSFAKSTNKIKQDKLKEIKLALEEHLGKKINIVFPD